MNTRKLLMATVGLVVALGGAASAQSFDQTHPRRDEVNQRLANQDARIHAERTDGQISGRRAHRLHMADRHIRRQERRFARHDHGHISLAERHRLNREENRVSRHIGR